MTRPRSHHAAAPAAPLIAAILILAGCATASKTHMTDVNLVDRVAQAHTPAEHENLASYFDEQAAIAERASEECRQLRKQYERTPQSLYYALGTAPALIAHYSELIESHRRNAESYRALAAWHRRQAAEGAENTIGPE